MDWIKVYYVLLVILLLWRAKFCGFKGWNEEFLSLSQTKAIQGPSFVSASKLCEPVVAAILAGFLFGELPGWLQVLGGMLILGGVLWYSRIESKQ